MKSCFASCIRAGWSTKSRFDAGAKDGRSRNTGPILAKYHELRDNRITALGQVLDAERNLRGIMGITSEDGTRLVPDHAADSGLLSTQLDRCRQGRPGPTP